MTSEDKPKAFNLVGVIKASPTTLDLVNRLTPYVDCDLPELDGYATVQYKSDGTKVLNDIREEFKREFSSKQVRHSLTVLTHSLMIARSMTSSIRSYLVPRRPITYHVS